ncbi:MAG: pentapeptide repeat-containing protein [Eubacterium sp.]|nr:pentapeptide repeat-containing protein [Eubacterium sp.]
MDTKKIEIQEAIQFLAENYPSQTMNNNKSIGGDERRTLSNEKYIRKSMKRSSIRNIDYQNCTFTNVAFADSCFHEVGFIDSELEGNSFVYCNFVNCNFSNKDKEFLCSANNFSQSNFTNCTFDKFELISSGLLQSLFNNCKFERGCLKSSTMEGSRFLGGSMSEYDLSRMNVEFIELSDISLQNVSFPFYQFPYIIGMADYILDCNNTITLYADNLEVSMQEYISQIPNLILFYEDKAEYFPICNLQIASNERDAAQQSLLKGIDSSLEKTDFRMVKYYCRLAQRHNLLDEVTAQRILNRVEDELTKEHLLPEQLNECITHAGEIRNLIKREKRNKIHYNFRIRTNINKEDEEGIAYINSLCNNLNTELSKNPSYHEGFEVAVSNYSPFEIFVQVMATMGSIATIAQLVWNIVEAHKANQRTGTKVTLDGYTPVDSTVYHQLVGTRIDLCKEQLLNIKDKYSERKLNQYITEITQKLKTDIIELYDKDIMIFKKDNTPED